ncbi:MAG TPA: P-loop NTPase, partial [Chitinispirillaceae bacterium]|nr:P-loop NTPase [Chitinispirillaceae bacterium]
KLSREFGVPLLGEIPIDLEIGRSGDFGIPLMISSPDSEAGCIFQDIAEKILTAMEKDHS